LKRRTIAALAALLAFAAAPVLAQAPFPSKSIQIVVPYAPGGVVDPVARLLAPRLSKELGQPVVVENRPGAAGAMGTAFVGRAEPDGHTILLNTGVVSVHPSTQKNPGYDTRRDLVPVSMIASGPYVLVVNNSLPVTNVREFLAYAKANPGKLFYGSSGTGSSLHLITELLNSESGLDIKHVPYKGNGPVMTALIGGEIQMAFDTIPGSKALGDAGRVRMLAVTSEGRNAALPNLPSLSEGGVKGFEAVLWEGFFLPKGTPDAIVAKWNAAIRTALQDPEVKKRLTELGFDVAGSTARELKDRVEADLAKWAGVTKHARINLE
jgi:tripartite-type tricarboxylate transporter receptor subunit TctC